jgi:hypothetical protein
VRSINLASGIVTTITYSVQNNTNKTSLNTLTIDPYYAIPGNPLTLTVQNNTCTASLPPGASCTFGLLVKANGATTSSVPEPRVCDYDTGTCSIPIEGNRIRVKSGGTLNSVAYIINGGGNLLSICPISTNFGYISNNGTTGINSNSVSICLISTTTHTLGSCSIFSDPTFNQPTSIGLCTHIVGTR